MGDNSDINLKDILCNATKEIANQFPDLQEYLCKIAEDELQRRLTPRQTRLVTKKLLEKIDFKAYR